jgi:hypothetical protein
VKKIHKNSFKYFVTNLLKINYTSLYAYKRNLIPVLKKMRENFINEIKTNQCDEEKLLKIVFTFNKLLKKENIEIFCNYLSKEDLKEFDTGEVLPDIDSSVNDEILRKILGNLRTYKHNKKENIKDNPYLFIFIFLKHLKQLDKKYLKKILKDNELTLEKLKCLNEKEFEFVIKRPVLLTILKHIPLKLLKKIKERLEDKE